MSEGVINQKESAQPPRWLVAAIVLITAAATVWAMSATNLEGSRLAWDQFEQNVTGIWAAPQPLPSPSPEGGWARPVAGVMGAPPIAAGAQPPHADRGTCTSCHQVVSARGTPMPAIAPGTPLPHANVGQCRNCHVVQPAVSNQQNAVPQPPVAPVAGFPALGPYGSFVAGAQPPPAGAPASPAVAPPPPPPQQPTEAEWMGLEVSPGKTGGGVVVAGAEATAARAGMTAGDVISSINGARITTMLDFTTATDNGRLAQGTVVVKRGTQRLAFELGTSPATPPLTPPAAPPLGAMPGAMPGAVPPGYATPSAAAAPPVTSPQGIPGMPPGGSVIGPGAPERRF